MGYVINVFLEGHLVSKRTRPLGFMRFFYCAFFGVKNLRLRLWLWDTDRGCLRTVIPYIKRGGFIMKAVPNIIKKSIKNIFIAFNERPLSV